MNEEVVLRRGIPATPCKRIISRKAKRVSDDAGVALKLVLQQVAYRIGLEAIDYMNEEGKKTLKPKHIIRAYESYVKSHSLFVKREH